MKYQHLVKPKHTLQFVGNKLVRIHAGFYEERDVHGTEAHWAWLIAHWHWAADMELGRERRSRQCL